MVKLFDPNVTSEEVEAAKEVLLSRNWASGAGLEKVKIFEDEFRKYLSCKEVVTVNSGTAALHLALSLISSPKKDILVPSLSFVSTAHAAVYNGANPVFVDVNASTMCMDVVDLEKKIKPDKALAILPVHFGGMPCNMGELEKLANAYNLVLIDDAAHACGSRYGEKRIGSMSYMTCFSFHPVKNLSMPCGGAIAINSDNPKREKSKLESLRWCGIDKRVGTSYDVVSITPNYYLNEVSAAIGIVQLKRLEALNARRKKIARRYSKEINIEHKMPYSDNCVYHLYWVLSDRRDQLIKYLNEHRIEVGTHYRPIHTMTAYKDVENVVVPVTEKVGTEIVTIPMHSNLSDNDVSYVIKTINNFV